MDLDYDKAEAVLMLLDVATSQITVVNLGKGIPNDYSQPKLVWR
jgi:hypothetical protein